MVQGPPPKERSSATDPLHPAFLEIPSVEGQLGFSMCPGRNKLKMQHTWRRSLAADVTVLKEQYNVNTVVTLMQEQEIEKDVLGNLAVQVKSRDMQHIAYGIRDKWLPPSSESFSQLCHTVAAQVKEGKTVLVHCNGGKGRSAMTCACIYIVLTGASSTDALKAVRTACPDCFKNPLQQLYMWSIRSRLVVPPETAPPEETAEEPLVVPRQTTEQPSVEDES
uniref:Tyrosine specific protein phosphatases domain-containing protein n=1 Tax=Chromera velia CCMP2878 TaxID=1169474 RepID=A0A0G4FBQ7_9ALVE|eukprot:Cvel_16238.t1-p1 / transcript=Cvel_16238.t1 / gene=Cvel_16238 / organism=Chromera_velia_CCMP2878 / gene_product=hypothetical protein / transcript_product=hypothetical protein / location=Cvel_scaffold1242:6264-6926(-) / protein_length=221 / sequence_SO=supercontig / SO=protein_coding / is_pseudo=false